VTACTAARLPRLRLRDLALALGVGLLLMVGMGFTLDEPLLLGLAWDEHGLLDHRPRALAEALPLALRRVAPLLVFGVVAALALADQVVNRRPEPLPLAVLVALNALALRRRLLVAALAATAYVLALVAVAAASGSRGLGEDLLYVAPLAVAGTLLLTHGQAKGLARADEAERREEQTRRAAEAGRTATVGAERARIAREMHDVVGHDLSVVVASAALGRRTQRSPAAARIFTDIEEVGRDALSALRQVLRVLRVEPVNEARTGTAVLDRFETVVERVRRAGLDVGLVVHGRPRPLPRAVEQGALRVVQESLTNALRHGGPGRCTVVLDYADEALDVEVRNDRTLDGPAADVGSGGSGLRGLRDRMVLLGGELDAGPEEPSGFLVRARLPVTERAG
jgi:signal transduction histidine kinase